MTSKNPKGRKGEPGGQGGDKSHACGMSSGALQRGFDDEAGAQDVISHVAGCDPCGSVLEVLQAQRDAVQFLTASSVVMPAHTAVEHILASSARAGRVKLADLLYEMAKACLIVLPDLKRRIERKVEPREVPVVSGELHSLNSRLEKTDGAVALRDVPQQTPEEARALKVARNCLTILDNVEGASERQQLAWSQVLIFEGKPAEAEGVLRGMLDPPHRLVFRDLVLRNTMLSLMEQQRYSEAIQFGKEALQHGTDQGPVLFNIVRSAAWLRDLDRFRAASSELSECLQVAGPSWLLEAIRFEVPQMAALLNLAPSEVERSCGIARRKDQA